MRRKKTFLFDCTVYLIAVNNEKQMTATSSDTKAFRMLDDRQAEDDVVILLVPQPWMSPRAKYVSWLTSYP